MDDDLLGSLKPKKKIIEEPTIIEQPPPIDDNYPPTNDFNDFNNPNPPLPQDNQVFEESPNDNNDNNCYLHNNSTISEINEPFFSPGVITKRVDYNRYNWLKDPGIKNISRTAGYGF